MLLFRAFIEALFFTPFCDHEDGLNPPVSILQAAAAQIFLLFDSSSNLLLLDADDPDDPGKIEAA